MKTPLSSWNNFIPGASANRNQSIREVREADTYATDFSRRGQFQSPVNVRCAKGALYPLDSGLRPE